MRRLVVLLVFSFVLSACSDIDRDSVQATARNKAATETAAELDQVAEYYFEEIIKLDPFGAPSIGDYRFNDQFGNPLSDDYLQARLKLATTVQEKLNALDRSVLNENRIVTYDLLAWNVEKTILGKQFPNHLLPLNQFRSRANSFVRYGSGKGAQPFNTLDDYQAFIEKANGFKVWVDSAIQRMREGMQENIVLPKALVIKMLPQLSAHIVAAAEDSLYWSPVENIPDAFSAQDKAGLREAYRSMIMQVIVPAYQKLHHFVQTEYLPKARASAGYLDLPNGSAWYQYWIDIHTGTDMTADQIHMLGLQQVARIRKEMDEVKQAVEFEGSLAEFLKFMRDDEQFFFKSSDEVIAAYTNVRKKIEARLSKFFNIQPKMDYVIRPVEAYRAASAAGASYADGSPDGSRPGIFFINTHNLKAQPKYLLETLSIHEASPGHHFQSSVQIELENVPRIRRFGSNVAYSEGWALYAESLGKEMGLFTDPYQYFGRLSDEMLRAMRLVVDTGLHAKGWTREQAIAYMQNNSSMADSDITAEVERYMAIPGQALGYKVGELKIRALRQYAEKALGDRFDIRAFHTQVLSTGTVPLSILETSITDWVESQR